MAVILLQCHPVSLVAANDETPVLADREKIGRVLVNLLSNAAKYSPAGKQITVRVTADDSEVAVIFDDAVRRTYGDTRPNGHLTTPAEDGDHQGEPFKGGEGSD